MSPVRTTEPLWSSDGHVVTLSRSNLQDVSDCPLRWLAERHGGTDPRNMGSKWLRCWYALIAQQGAGDSQLLAALERAWPDLPFESRWYSANELARHRAMLPGFPGVAPRRCVASWPRSASKSTSTGLSTDTMVGIFGCAAGSIRSNATQQAVW